MLQLNRECIILNMQATSKESALRELATNAVQQFPQLDHQHLFSVLMEREQVGSTGVGNGVAIPHGKVDGIKEIILCFGRSPGGINFDAIDNRPVFLFALLLSPRNIATEYLKALAAVSKILKQPANRASLLRSKSIEEVLSLFSHTS